MTIIILSVSHLCILCVQVNSELFIVETLKIGVPKDSRIWLQSKHLKVSMYYAIDHNHHIILLVFAVWCVVDCKAFKFCRKLIHARHKRC